MTKVLDILELVGLKPTEFFSQAFRQESLLETRYYYTLSGTRPTSPVIKVRQRAENLQVYRAQSLGQEFLDEIDRLKYEDPKTALRLAETAAEQISRPSIPWYLGVLGSCYRLNLRLNDAEHALYEGLNLALKDDETTAHGELLLRLSSLSADRGQYRVALRIAEEAVLLYGRTGAFESLARALVRQGVWLFATQQYSESRQALDTALQHLPEEQIHSRYTALQALGLCYHSLGELGEAEKVLTQMEGFKVPPMSSGKAVWLRAKINWDLGNFRMAEKLLGSVVETFSSIHPGEAALATCELVHLKILNGKQREAIQAAQTMLRFVEPLAENPVISAVIADLLRNCHQGIELTLLEEARERIEKERERPEWRSLQKLVS